MNHTNLNSRPIKYLSSDDRAFRGGGWDTLSIYCRTAYRRGVSPGNRNVLLGFRLAFNHPMSP
jgi:formylglycine-generating enzyme required for sulfatase activity